MIEWICFLENHITKFPQDFIEIGIIIEIPKSLQKEIQEKDQHIHLIDQSSLLKNKPHISSGQGLFKKENIEKLKNKIALISAYTYPFLLKT